MDTREFSDQFDVLYQNVASSGAPGCNEYEKSVFLTKAQDQLINEYFNIRTDGAGGGYDGSQRRQYDFSSLVRVASLQQIEVDNSSKLDKRSKVFLFPEDYFLSVNELISDNTYQYNVLPLSYGEYSRLMMKPYAYPVKRGAWRIFTNKKQVVTYTATSTADYGHSISSPLLAHFANGFTITAYKNERSLDIKKFTIVEIRENNEVIGEAIHFLYSTDPEVQCTLSMQTDNVWLLTYYDSRTQELVPDTEIVKYIQDGFAQLRQYNLLGTDSVGKYAVEMADYTDNCSSLVAPQDHYYFYNFPASESQGDGVIFGKPNKADSIYNTPRTIAEIVVRNQGTVQYQLRYIKEPAPIILVDLATDFGDLKIKGQSGVSQCELPEEMHQEILERAVTLAKIAWQGGTVTQAAAAAQNSNNNA